MSPERWQEIKNTVKKQYPDAEIGQEDLMIETADGLVKQGVAEFLIFENPALGRVKLAFQKKPRLEEKKYHYSHRQGTTAKVEYKYSEQEMVYTFKAYQWDEEEEKWKEIDATQISNF